MFDATRPAHAPADHPKVKMGRVGILLANLGTPDDYSYWPMRRYLNEFLSLGRGLQVDLEPRQGRKPADDHHKGPDRQNQGRDEGALR